MTFRIVWTPTAEADLARIWTTALDRRLITSAANTLDMLLQIDAHQQGESRSDSLRIVHAEPLGADIDVDEDTGTAWVLRVWRVKKHNS